MKVSERAVWLMGEEVRESRAVQKEAVRKEGANRRGYKKDVL